MLAASDAGVRNWTTASTELLKLVLSHTGRCNALDFLTISPLRHGDLLKWRLTSTWWRATWIGWSKAHWEVTWHDLPLDERAAYGLRQPI
ncbi:hypothetical protein Plhal304r1_c103g0175431 [Plasmopara halstedii]